MSRSFSQFLGWFAWAVVVFAVSAASAQVFIPPPPAAPQAPGIPNPDNPNQRLRPARPNAVEPGYSDIQADSQEVDGPWRRLRGNVKLETTEMQLKADELDYNSDTSEVHARGHVVFDHFLNGDHLECDHADYNIDDETGVFYEVHGTAPSKIAARPGLLTTTNPFYFEGQWAERVHEKYILHSGFITDCKVPRPWWTLNGPKFDIIPNDRAIAYHATYRIRGVPLFYLPTFYKSLKKEPRKSGFLTPNIGHSSLFGYVVGIDYYWAINRSYDAIIRMQDYSARGPAETLEVRGNVMPGTDFNGTVYSVQDRTGVQIGENNGQPVIQKQGGENINFQGHSGLGDGWLARGEFNYLSSYLFLQAFSQTFTGAVFSESRSVGYITKHWDTFGVNVIADRDEQFISTVPGDTIDIRKLPNLEFLSREHEISDKILPVWFSLDSSGGLFSRSEAPFLTPALIFEPALSTSSFVTRFDVNPTVTSSIHLGNFTFMPSFSIDETEYGSSFLQPGSTTVSGQNLLRNAREFDLVFMAPPLARVYKAPKWLGVKMKHVIEARAEYRNVGGVSDFDRIIRFDALDLLTDTNELRLSLANRLFVKDKDGNVNEVLNWILTQARYFDPTFGGAVPYGQPPQRYVTETTSELTGYDFLSGPRRYSPVVSVLRFQKKIGLEWRADYDPLYHQFLDNGFTADIRFSKYFFQAGDSEVHMNPVLAPSSNQVHWLVGYGNQNRKGWNGAFSTYYDIRLGIIDFSTLEVTYNTDCCGISVEYRRFNVGARNDSGYLVSFAISNVGTFGSLKRQERIF